MMSKRFFIRCYLGFFGFFRNYIFERSLAPFILFVSNRLGILEQLHVVKSLRIKTKNGNKARTCAEAAVTCLNALMSLNGKAKDKLSW